ncbi:MAG: hypothetical protein H6721_12355 [Sandaracinus sp.]|nr:hypothetical protein [Sandaracinus sp.]
MNEAATIRAFAASLKDTIEKSVAMTPEAFAAYVRAPDFDLNAAATERALEILAFAKARAAAVADEDARAAVADLLDVGESFEKLAAKIFELRGGGRCSS